MKEITLVNVTIERVENGYTVKVQLSGEWTTKTSIFATREEAMVYATKMLNNVA